MKTIRTNSSRQSTARARGRNAGRDTTPRSTNAHRAPRTRARSGARAPIADALVTDPERLLAALEQAESAASPSNPRPRMRSGEHAVTALLDDASAPQAESAPPIERVPVLRENETAVQTACGAFVVRRRRIANAA